MSGSSASAGDAVRAGALIAMLCAAAMAVAATHAFAQLPGASAPAPRPGPPLDLTPAPRKAPSVPPASPAIRAEPLSPPGGAPPEPAGTAAHAMDPGTPSSGPWRGIPEGMVRALVPALPEANPSPTVRALMSRLLAPPPAGETQGSTPELDRLRFAKLLAIGAGEEAAALAAASPGLLDDPDAARRWIDRLLLAGEVGEACARKLPLPPGTAERLRVLCLASAGRTDEVALAAGLLREQGGGDPLFLALADALSGAGGGDLPDAPDGPDPIHLAMMRLAGRPAPLEAFRTRDPARLAALAAMETYEAAARADAAERAAAAGALDAAGLAQAYRAAASSGAEGRARLYAEALAAGGTGRGRLVAQAVEGLPGPLLAGAVGAAWAELLDGAGTGDGGPPLDAGEEEALARLLLVLGRPGAFDRLDRLARIDGAAAARLWPLAALGGGGLGDGVRLDEAGLGLSAWLEVASRDDAVAAARVLALFEAMGETVPQDAWLAVLDPGQAEAVLPSAALLRQLRDAAPAGSADEVLLAVLAAMGDGAPAEQPAAVLSPVLGSLRAAGFGTQARDLAREAVPASGL